MPPAPQISQEIEFDTFRCPLFRTQRQVTKQSRACSREAVDAIVENTLSLESRSLRAIRYQVSAARRYSQHHDDIR